MIALFDDGKRLECTVLNHTSVRQVKGDYFDAQFADEDSRLQVMPFLFE